MGPAVLGGIVPTTAKSVVATAVTFAAYETCKDFLVGAEGASGSGGVEV
eukprot:gene27501-34228_t